MSTYTYNGTATSNYIDLDEIITPQYSNYIVNGAYGDDEIDDSVLETATRVTLNGDGGDDTISTYGQHDAWLSGGDGGDFRVRFLRHESSSFSSRSSRSLPGESDVK